MISDKDVYGTPYSVTTYTMKFKKGDILRLHCVGSAGSFSDYFNSADTTLKNNIKNNFLPFSDKFFGISIRDNSLDYDINMTFQFGTIPQGTYYSWTAYCLHNCELVFNKISNLTNGYLVIKYRSSTIIPNDTQSGVQIAAGRSATLPKISNDKILIVYAPTDIKYVSSGGDVPRTFADIQYDPFKWGTNYTSSNIGWCFKTAENPMIREIRNDSSSATRTCHYRIIDRITD